MNDQKQKPILLALAIIGISALVYGGWTLYQRHIAQQQAQVFFGGATQIPGVGEALKSKPQPPPQ